MVTSNPDRNAPLWICPVQNCPVRVVVGGAQEPIGCGIHGEHLVPFQVHEAMQKEIPHATE